MMSFIVVVYNAWVFLRKSKSYFKRIVVHRRIKRVQEKKFIFLSNSKRNLNTRKQQGVWSLKYNSMYYAVELLLGGHNGDLNH